MAKRRATLASLLRNIAVLFVLGSAPAAADDYGLGRPATSNDIAGWDIDVSPDGRGLPAGHGDVDEGAQIFANKCAACHAAHGEGKPMDALVGGAGTIGTLKPVKTVGSYWPYATTLYDFIHRAMPFDAPQSLSADETYAVTGYVLYLNHLVAEHAVLDAATLPAVKMPACPRFQSRSFTDIRRPSC